MQRWCARHFHCPSPQLGETTAKGWSLAKSAITGERRPCEILLDSELVGRLASCMTSGSFGDTEKKHALMSHSLLRLFSTGTIPGAGRVQQTKRKNTVVVSAPFRFAI